MEFSIIPSEQTPAVDPQLFKQQYKNVREYIYMNADKLATFKEYAAGRPNAVGLAANQCALNGERFMHPVFAIMDLTTKVWSLIIAPQIIEYVGMSELKREGCLTWGKEKVVIAPRHRAVTVSYWDADGNAHVGETYRGFVGQIWQHEINHLEGVEERIEPVSFKLTGQHKPGRNEPCPCGSHKKYKQCCADL